MCTRPKEMAPFQRTRGIVNSVMQVTQAYRPERRLLRSFLQGACPRVPSGPPSADGSCDSFGPLRIPKPKHSFATVVRAYIAAYAACEAAMFACSVSSEAL